ncbi:MAG: hypothetical protein PHO41_11055, partial [Eubacteriales bacterium]|nr:hypothetical protein [Eubacteriales bacterium]
SLAEACKACALLLKNLGRAWLCFPASRMLELTDALRAVRLEPKRMRMVCAKAEKAPYLLLVEAVKNGKPSLLWMPPLIVYNDDGTQTSEFRHIYGLV